MKKEREEKERDNLSSLADKVYKISAQHFL